MLITAQLAFADSQGLGYRGSCASGSRGSRGSPVFVFLMSSFPLLLTKYLSFQMIL